MAGLAVRSWNIVVLLSACYSMECIKLIGLLRVFKIPFFLISLSKKGLSCSVQVKIVCTNGVLNKLPHFLIGLDFSKLPLGQGRK